MKKVSRDDLRFIVAKHYFEFLDRKHETVSDIIAGKGFVKLSVNSISICLTCGNPDVRITEEAVMGEFAKNIEAISFGNLKVIRVITDIYCTDIIIANAYEVVN